MSPWVPRAPRAVEARVRHVGTRGEQSRRCRCSTSWARQLTARADRGEDELVPSAAGPLSADPWARACSRAGSGIGVASPATWHQPRSDSCFTWNRLDVPRRQADGRATTPLLAAHEADPPRDTAGRGDVCPCRSRSRVSVMVDGRVAGWARRPRKGLVVQIGVVSRHRESSPGAILLAVSTIAAGTPGRTARLVGFRRSHKSVVTACPGREAARIFGRRTQRRTALDDRVPARPWARGR